MKRHKRWMSLLMSVMLLSAITEGIHPVSHAADDGILRFNAEGKFTVMQLISTEQHKIQPLV